MKRFLALVCLVLAALAASARAQSLDDQYVQIFNTIQEADAITDTNPRLALSKYTEAQIALLRLQRGSPDWNIRVVGFRLNYLAGRIAELSGKPMAQPVTPAATNRPPAIRGAATPPPGTGAPPDWEDQLNSLKLQVKQLQSDKTLLEAKLKEALALTPAAIDPRELAKAEEKIRSLQKENDLLKLALDAEKQNSRPADAKALQDAQTALAEANRKLAAESARSKTLEAEQTALQNKLDNLIAAPWNASNIESTRKALEKTNQKLAEEKQITVQLNRDKESLQQQLAQLRKEVDASAALREENQLLKKQLAGVGKPVRDETAAQQLAQAQAQLAALESDKQILRLERGALEQRVRQLTAVVRPPVAVTAPLATAAPDLARIKALEWERDDLQKKLAAANKELAGRKGKANVVVVEQLQSELASVRLRLEVLEMRKVPYTPEELALFKQPEPHLVAETPPAKAASRELSPGSVRLVAEARGFFARGQLAQAEANYTQVVKQENNNVSALTDLANIQLQGGRLDQAEINVKQALDLVPEDAYALSVLGRIRFQQRKFDEALEVLSRAAKLDAENPEIQNYLGLVLSEKGLRGPAEAALRKAIQLSPQYGSAHHNLAVVYITQKPPLTELAKWHYQKALAAGHPKNPELEKLLNR